jgi:hypothetical protein
MAKISIQWSVAVLGAVVVVAGSPVLPAQATVHTTASGLASLTVSSAAAKRPPRSLQVTVNGLPKGARAKVTVKGPGRLSRTVRRSITLRKLAVGKYRLVAKPVTVGSATYRPTVKPARVKIGKKTSGRATVTYRTTQTPTPEAPLRFAIQSASGVALKSGTASAKVTNVSALGSNLVAVAADGTISDAVSSGSVNVSEFHIAADGTMYLAFGSTTLNSVANCVLARVDRVTGVPTCVDSTGQAVTLDMTGTRNAAIQQDQAGNLYYRRSSQLVRNSAGTVTAINSPGTIVTDFVVMPGGTIFMQGQTTMGALPWVRSVSPSGQLSTLSSQMTSFLRRFPDGDVYFLDRRVSGQTMQLDPNPVLACPSPVPADYNQYCSSAGVSSGVSNFYPGTGDTIFALLQPGRFVRFFPTRRDFTSDVTNIRSAQSVRDGAYLAGTNSNGQNILTRLDATTGAETTILGPDQIEIYRLRYASGSDRLMFDGLRYSDNQYVVGTVNPTTLEVTATATGGTQLADLQTF